MEPNNSAFNPAVANEMVDAAILSAFNVLMTGNQENARAIMSGFAKAQVHGRRFAEVLAEAQKSAWVELAKALRGRQKDDAVKVAETMQTAITLMFEKLVLDLRTVMDEARNMVDLANTSEEVAHG